MSGWNQLATKYWEGREQRVIFCYHMFLLNTGLLFHKNGRLSITAQSQHLSQSTVFSTATVASLSIPVCSVCNEKTHELLLWKVALRMGFLETLVL